jgi:hypothetical protein
VEKVKEGLHIIQTLTTVKASYNAIGGFRKRWHVKMEMFGLRNS